jgi:hypothetical protein|tara:strand:- start:405 stop:569 length:165 start_codon:yes stop_codon:yes gene_type:complete
MEEVIVEGLDYEDFVTLKKILKNNTHFKFSDTNLFANNAILIEKIEKIIEVFEE